MDQIEQKGAHVVPKSPQNRLKISFVPDRATSVFACIYYVCSTLAPSTLVLKPITKIFFPTAATKYEKVTKTTILGVHFRWSFPPESSKNQLCFTLRDFTFCCYLLCLLYIGPPNDGPKTNHENSLPKNGHKIRKSVENDVSGGPVWVSNPPGIL